MHDIPLLINLTIALLVAFIGGLLARRIGLPTIVGYLLAGIAIGPFTPGFTGDVSTISQLAELGVIFLMFGVGLHFSFSDLWRVRDIAVPGALLQTLAASLLGFGLSRLWGWSIPAGIVLGLSISVASTVVLLRGLMDNSLLNTSHGQAAVGWLVMEDILSVLILVLMPAFAGTGSGFNWQNLLISLLKAAVFIGFMFFAGTRFIPWLLAKIAHSNSRELFILAILAITLGTSLGGSELFGISLALGAFVAGAIISQSHLSEQVGADVYSFRESFSVIFFVSVGMLVNPVFLYRHVSQIILLTLLVVAGKILIVLALGLLFPKPAKTFLIVAIGLSQVGEFSFILGRAGVSLGMMDNDQYSLILAASLISIGLNPFLYKLLPRLEARMRKLPWLWKERTSSTPAAELNMLKGHAVIVGYGRIGRHLVDVLESLSIPLLVIEKDPERIAALNSRKVPVLYGDVASSEIIRHAHLDTAKVLVTSLPDDIAATLVVTTAKDINPQLPIITRATTIEGMRYLSTRGAHHVVQPELEGGLEMIHHTLINLGYPLQEVHAFTEAIRHDQYDYDVNTEKEHASLHEMLTAFKGIEIKWLEVNPDSSIAGKSLLESNIRMLTGASVVALMRNGQLTANPKSVTVFEAGDRIGLIGETSQLALVEQLIHKQEQPDTE